MAKEGVIIPGLVREASQVVNEELSAPYVGSGSLEVFATPSMAASIENLCHTMVAPLLQEGQTTVGSAINLRHLAPTPVGGTVRTRAEVVSVNGRRIEFRAEVWDDHELVGEADHTRFIVDVERFLKRVQAKAP